MSSLYSTEIQYISDDDDVTVATSNCSDSSARNACFSALPHEGINAVSIASTEAIADSGATSIFLMDNVDVANKRHASKPLVINLPDGRKVKSTHICDIAIPGLSTMLTGHIVPELKIASLIGIRPLCKAGCRVIFDDNKCDVEFNGEVILRGFKDPSTELWTLPITPAGMQSIPPQLAPVCPRVTHPNTTIHNGVNLASFTHSVCTRANGVKFAHQSLCSPSISTLLKAVRKGFLQGCPNMTEKLILKYLNPSPATTKGHMKRARHGIKSTQKRAATQDIVTILPVPNVINLPIVPAITDNFLLPHAYIPTVQPNLILDDSNESIANVFCFGAFADRHSGVVYNDLTGNFPFMSFDGSVCFLVVYHYESNAILAYPIAGLDDVSIFNAYEIAFDKLTAKGFKPKLNIMDNQATKYIKKFLTAENCALQLVEPHNHRVNAAERAIQTFKNAFIAALATTDRDFPLQLWDRLTPQMMNCLNMLRASRIDPTKSAYETLYGPYDWNRYPLAPLGCKAIIYEDGDTRGSWASRGVDGWYLGPSLDHYRCNLYYVPDTRAYRISGTTELFPQHCQLPDMTAHQHYRALTDELSDGATMTGTTAKGRRLLQLLQTRIKAILDPPPTSATNHPVIVPTVKQRVITRDLEQRVIDESPIITVPIQRITDAPGIMTMLNPTAKRNLKATPRLHRRVTRNNMPGILPVPVLLSSLRKATISCLFPSSSTTTADNILQSQLCDKLVPRLRLMGRRHTPLFHHGQIDVS